jgi:hypothetical protein
MRYILWIILMAVIAILSAAAVSHSQNKGCANILNDPRAYGNWQNSRQQSDYNSIQRQNGWGNYLEKSNQPSWLVDDARAKQRSMENMSESSRRYNEFFGPHNKYGK